MVSRRIRVNVGGGYDVEIGPGILASSGDLIRQVRTGGRLALISDEAVAALFAEPVLTSLRNAGFDITLLTVPAGEDSKAWAVAGDLLERIAAAGLDRECAFVALGGGVVGDLAGFCAAVYMRGVPFVQMPTTLLAQVDSSVGGKTGVDLRAGKNLAGAFIQPELVIADTSALSTLPEIEWRSGLAEVAKSALLDSEDLLAWLETHAGEVLGREPDAIERVVDACVAFKARVVESDERESGDRESLNYGHTLGHAIERVAGYGSVPHGLAVSEGIRFAAKLAERVLGTSPDLTRRQERLLDELGLSRLERAFSPDAIRLAMSSDKKARGGRVRFVLLESPGSFVTTVVDGDILAEELQEWIASSEGMSKT